MKNSRLAALCLAVAACGPVSDMRIAVLPALASADTTLTATIKPTHAVLAMSDPSSPAKGTTAQAWVSKGYGASEAGPGEPTLTLPPAGMMAAPTPGANAKMLTRFVHLPDTQLADDESPNRLVTFDTAQATAGASRPQEGSQCRVLNAAVRTINGLHKATPIDFVLTGGDNTDSAQQNELDWFLKIMDGAPEVKCDSGDVNDPVAGPNNDGKDPFKAEGLAMPWKWVTGNHDVLIVGTTPVTDDVIAQALGTKAPAGTRDYTKAGAPVFNEPVVADEKRRPMHRVELMTAVSKDKDGHGVGADQIATGKAFYAFDVANTQLRFVILDTCNEFGDADGIIHQPDVTNILKPLLDQAKADGKWVVIASHHATNSITDGSGFGGTRQPDALTGAQWENFLGGYDNLVFSMVGHTHKNRIRMVTPPNGTGHAFWEVMTSSLADFPHQFRLVEIWDEDNGWLKLKGTVANYSVNGDDVSAGARVLGIADYVAGWAPDGSGAAQDRNVEIFIRKP